MKNNTLSGRYCFKNPRFKQIFRIMRISTFLLMVSVCSVRMLGMPILKMQKSAYI